MKHVSAGRLLVGSESARCLLSDFFNPEVFAVKNRIALVRNPVAENDDAAVVNVLIEEHMVVAEQIEVHFVTPVLFNPLQQRGWTRSFDFALCAVRRAPAVGQAYGPARMDRSEHALEQAAAERCPHQALDGGNRPHAVAVSKEKALAVNCLFDGSVNEAESDFTGQIVKNPDVMIACDPRDFNSAVSQFGKGAEEAREAAGNHVAILKPIVQNVTQKVEPAAVWFDFAQPAADGLLMFACVTEITRAQMKVTYEICQSACGQRNPNSSFASSLIMSWVHSGSKTMFISTDFTPRIVSSFRRASSTRNSAAGQLGAVRVMST